MSSCGRLRKSQGFAYSAESTRSHVASKQFQSDLSTSLLSQSTRSVCVARSTGIAQLASGKPLFRLADGVENIDAFGSIRKKHRGRFVSEPKCQDAVERSQLRMNRSAQRCTSSSKFVET